MTKPMFSTKVEDANPVHTRVKVYNYGGYSGTLVVNTDDAEELIMRLTGAALEQAYREGVKTKINKLLENEEWLERVMEHWNWPHEWKVATRLKEERDRAKKTVRRLQEFIDQLETEHDIALEQAIREGDDDN